MLASELFESQKICPVCGCTPCNCTHIVKENIQLSEFAPSKGMGDNDGPSKIVQIVDKLLKSGNKVDCMVLGARGHVVKADLEDDHWGNGGLHMKKYNKPYAKTGLYRPFVTADDDKYEIVPVGHKHYAIKDVWPEDVKEGLKDPKDNPCWKGYHPVGTKKKAGKTVPNCVPEGTEVVPAANPEDTVSLDIPLLIRLLEYSREDAKTDMDLHNVAERLITLSAGGRTLSMNDYDTIIPGSAD